MEKREVSFKKIILIGGSAGSLEVLLQLLPKIKPAFPYPIAIIIHRKNSGDSILIDLLKSKTDMVVKEIEEKEPIVPGNIYIAPGDYHVLFEKDLSFSLDYSEKINFSRPSIDVAFQSAADVFGNQVVAILLSGANADGTDGFKYIKSKGGATIAQSPETANVSYMPEQAIAGNTVDQILDVNELAIYLNSL